MIPSRLLLTLTAAILAVGGVPMIFAPEYVSQVLIGPSEAPAWPIQILGAAWYGFAILNWMSRNTILGGIYGRPLTVANLSHFLIVALTLLKLSFDAGATTGMWILLAISALFAFLFGVRLYANPPESESAR